ncbi:hypothetical protein M9Y10_012032 [Tritrichomonas musculus]|uniref:Lecithin:cholesterol acyltransferase family protein n=1 Tax=Tritrichomonas musculus TaxID=1915356 RepID=A0ABR2ICI0_9EUKA
MILILINLISSLKPVILLPPLYGTNLHVSYTNANLPWYCPKTMNDNLLWIDPKLLVPPRYNCVLQLLQSFYNNKTGKVENRPGVDISVHDFGGEQSVQYVDGGILGFQFFDTYASMLQYFKSHGYEIGRNLFTAPYDWRNAPVAIDDFWPKLKNLVEKAHQINGEKVTIMGYSCGGYSLHRFLTAKVTEDWKHEHIEKIVFTVPSFGGTMDAIDILLNHHSSVMPIHNENIAKLSEGLPFVHSHLLNEEVYGNLPLVRGPEGEIYTARDLPNLLISHNAIRKSFHDIMKVGVELTKKAPKDVNMPTAIIYNSGYPTRFTINFKNGWDQIPIVETSRGDGTVPSHAAEWACQHWEHKKYPKVCIDFDNHEERFRHQPLSRNPFVHELLFNMTSRSEWLNSTGLTEIHMPYIKINEDETYDIRNDIRSTQVAHFD